MRLACIYALLDCSRVIRVEHLRAAVALWDYAEASVRAIFGEQLGDPVADTILTALRNAPDGLTRAELGQLFGKHAAAAEMARALGMLHARGLVRVVHEPTEGRPAERWYACGKSGKSGKRSVTGEGGAA